MRILHGGLKLSVSTSAKFRGGSPSTKGIKRRMVEVKEVYSAEALVKEGYYQNWRLKQKELQNTREERGKEGDGGRCSPPRPVTLEIQEKGKLTTNSEFNH